MSCVCAACIVFNRSAFLPRIYVYAAPPIVNGFTANSLTPSSIALSWDLSNATVEYYRVSCCENVLHMA